MPNMKFLTQAYGVTQWTNSSVNLEFND